MGLAGTFRGGSQSQASRVVTDGSDAIVESTPECLRAILGNASHTAPVAGIGKAAAAAGQGKAMGSSLTVDQDQRGSRSE